MGSCSGRCTLLALCALQLVSPGVLLGFPDPHQPREAPGIILDLADFLVDRSLLWNGRCLTSWATSGHPSWPTSSTSSWSSWGSSAPFSIGHATLWCMLCGQLSGLPGMSSLSASTWKWGASQRTVSS
ncbi:hypothetical protein LEMLEM_LOCUS38 [Lemmus lemmus]